MPTPAYAPYVSAITASDYDSAGSPTTYNLAFVIAKDNDCTPAWDGSTDIEDAAVTSRVSELISSGGSLRVSYGGVAGKELATTCDSASELADAYGAALDAVGATEADFDIEAGHVADSDSVTLRSKAIALLQKERPQLQVSFTLPVMPSGLLNDSLALLESADHSGVEVSSVNIMTMNYGSSYDGDMGTYAISAAKATHAQLKEVFDLSTEDAWKRLALTPMIGNNDVANETFTLSDAAQVRAFAAEKDLAWVSMWSAARDQECAGGKAPANGAMPDCSGVEQRPGAFAQAFSD